MAKFCTVGNVHDHPDCQTLSHYFSLCTLSHLIIFLIGLLTSFDGVQLHCLDQTGTRYVQHNHVSCVDFVQIHKMTLGD